MKRFLTVITLTCVLSASALAGDVPTCGAPSPAPEATEESSTENTPTGGTTSPADIPTCGLSVVLTILDLVI